MGYETEDRDVIARLLARAGADQHLEALDESREGVDGLVTIRSLAPLSADLRPDALPGFVVIRWGQRAMGMGHRAAVVARTVTQAEALVALVPTDRGHVDLDFPFWLAGAVQGAFQRVAESAYAWYTADGLDGAAPAPPAAKGCQVLEDHALIKPMFPKLVTGSAFAVCAMGAEMVGVAAVTHAHRESVRVRAYVPEPYRGRGFGTAALSALVRHLVAAGRRVTAWVDLGDAASVRGAESVGLRLSGAVLGATLTGPLSKMPVES